MRDATARNFASRSPTTSVTGTASEGSASHSGSITPVPSPRSAAARPEGVLRRRSAFAAAATRSVHAGATIAVAGLNPSVRAFDLKDGKPAGELPAGGEVAARPHAFDHPRNGRPMVLMVTRDIAKGAAASLVMRSFDPPVTPLAPLPGLVQIAPLAPAAR